MGQLLLDKLDWLAGAWWTWMISMSIHVTVLVIFLYILDRFLRGTSARLRFALWLLVLARLVVPPDLAAPTGLVWWTGQWWPDLNAVALADPTPIAVAAVNETSVHSDANISSSLTIVSTSRTAAWQVSLFMVWLGMVICQLGFIAYGWLLVESWLSQAKDVVDERTAQLLKSARQKVGLRGQVQLRDSGQCTTPLVVGWFRPIVLLPTAVLETLRPAELEAVLVHELTHLKRGDCWWRFIQAVLRTLYFFHPAVWLAGRALGRNCEEACDELTVRALKGQRRDYAEAIFKAATVVGYQGPHLALNMLGDVLPVKHRLARILDPRLPQGPTGSWRHAIIVMVLAIVVLPTGQRRSQALPPEQARLSDLRLPIDNSPAPLDSPLPAPNPSAPGTDSPSQPSAVSTATALSQAPEVSVQERAALELLKSTQFEDRMQAYDLLAQVGTIHALSDLEAAFLGRSGIEQDAAERALKHVWELIRVLPSETNTSTRVFEAPAENEYVFP